MTTAAVEDTLTSLLVEGSGHKRCWAVEFISGAEGASSALLATLWEESLSGREDVAGAFSLLIERNNYELSGVFEDLLVTTLQTGEESARIAALDVVALSRSFVLDHADVVVRCLGDSSEAVQEVAFQCLYEYREALSSTIGEIISANAEFVAKNPYGRMVVLSLMSGNPGFVIGRSDDYYEMFGAPGLAVFAAHAFESCPAAINQQVVDQACQYVLGSDQRLCTIGVSVLGMRAELAAENASLIVNAWHCAPSVWGSIKAIFRSHPHLFDEEPVRGFMEQVHRSDDPKERLFALELLAVQPRGMTEHWDTIEASLYDPSKEVRDFAATMVRDAAARVGNESGEELRSYWQALGDQW